MLGMRTTCDWCWNRSHAKPRIPAAPWALPLAAAAAPPYPELPQLVVHFQSVQRIFACHHNLHVHTMCLCGCPTRRQYTYSSACRCHHSCIQQRHTPCAFMPEILCVFIIFSLFSTLGTVAAAFQTSAEHVISVIQAHQSEPASQTMASMPRVCDREIHMAWYQQIEVANDASMQTTHACMSGGGLSMHKSGHSAQQGPCMGLCVRMLTMAWRRAGAR